MQLRYSVFGFKLKKKKNFLKVSDLHSSVVESILDCCLSSDNIWGGGARSLKQSLKEFVTINDLNVWTPDIFAVNILELV